MVSEQERDTRGQTDMVLAPNGDIWMTYISGRYNESTLAPGNRGLYRSYNAAKKTWSPYTHISPEGFRNLDERHAQVPKFIYYKGSVLLFYAESQGTGPFSFYHKTVSGGSVTSHMPAVRPEQIVHAKVRRGATALTVDLPAHDTWTSATVYAHDGRVQMRPGIHNRSISLPTGRLACGLYLLALKGRREKATLKVIIP